jgi:spermidine synthase
MITDPSANRRQFWTVFGLLPLFFVSGATALTYQSLWVRELQLVFGTSTFAISTVLAAFMGGLAVGGFVAGRYADRVPHPLAVYGILEIGIGLYAFVFPWVVGVVTPVYLEVHRAMDPGPVVFGLVQFALVGSTLFLPTMLMGATLPLLARFATDRLGSAGDRIGTLYSVNTAGAVLGTLLCGFFLLPMIGRSDTTMLAAGANLVLGLAAIALDRLSGGEAGAVRDVNPAAPIRASGVLVVVSVAIGLAGFSALVYEVAWTRLLGLMLGASVYSFSLMLLAFLTGIALGGKLGGPIADALWRRGGLAYVLLAFALVEVSIAVVSFAMMYVYPELPFFYVWVFDLFDAGEHPQAVFGVSMVVSALVMTPPAILMGIHFPMAVRAVIGNEDELGGPVGIVYGANTLGGVAGAFLAGFVFLPTLWVQGTVAAAAVGEVLAALLLLAFVARLGTVSMGRVGAFGGVVVVSMLGMFVVGGKPPWDPLLMTAGMYHYVTTFDDHSREGIREYSVDLYDLVFYEEGLSSVVTVAKNKDSGNIWLANNGKVDASTTTDMPTQVLCALLPIAYAPALEDVLVIGLASGITAGAVSQVDPVTTMEVVELEPSIERAAEFFSAYNHDIVHSPKAKLIRNDGRNHVLLAKPGTYDVIISEPPNPWISGVANLFTKDFLEVGKSRLKPGGIWSQWIQLYGMDIRDLKVLLKTVATVYPHVLVFSTIEEADIVLVASESPLAPDMEKLDRLFQWPGVRKDLKRLGFDGPTDLVALYRFDREEIVNNIATDDLPLNTDDSMIIEYSAPLHLHVDTQDDNVQLLIDHSQLPLDTLPKDPNFVAGLARKYHDRGDLRAVRTLVKAIELLPPDDLQRQTWLDEANGWQRELEEQLAEENE